MNIVRKAPDSSAETPDDPLPVYQWLGIDPRSSETPRAPEPDEKPEAQS